MLLLAAVLFAFTAVPAHAGGPTSVLLSAPPTVIGLGYEDQRYADLQALVQTPTKAEPTGAQHDTGRFVRATWLIHDMSIWRIDIIYPDAPGGPWIQTEDLMTDTNPSKPTWHRAANPVRLLQLLGDLNLLHGSFEGGPTLTDGYAIVATPAPTPPPAQQAAAPTTTFFTGWRWTIPGVLLGAAITALALRLLPKRRWELIDQ